MSMVSKGETTYHKVGPKSDHLMNSRKFIESRLRCGHLLLCGFGHQAELSTDVVAFFLLTEGVPVREVNIQG